jgi:hypothetical protein
MTAHLWPLAGVVLAAAGVWMAMLALEYLLAWRRRRDPRRVSDEALTGYVMDELRESAPQYVSWPKQKKGAVGLWDRRQTKLRDVSRRAS